MRTPPLTSLIAAAFVLGANLLPVRAEQTITGTELSDRLTTALQQAQVKDKGTLELRLGRPWTAVTLPDGEVTVKILELPANGVGANFIVRFELHAGNQVRGPWQMPVQAQIWREVWVAGSALRVGQPLAEAGLVKERRDVLGLREPCWNGDAGDAAVELASFVPAGAVLPARSLRLRAVLHRGQRVEALLQAGSMDVSMQAEALQEGAPGQLVRIRNVRSGKEFIGRVQDEHTVLVPL